jgi:hypothetical protein
MLFSVAAAEGRPARSDITKEHLLGYYLKYVMGCRATAAFWSNPHDHLFVKDGPYKGLTLKEVEVAGPERDLSKPFPLAWIPQGASFHIKYPGDAPPSEPCNFFMTEVQGPGFMPAAEGRLLTAEKLMCSYCERFGLPQTRDPYSIIIWRQGEFKGLSLRASLARLDAEKREAPDPAPAPAPAPAKLSSAEAKAQIGAKETALLQELAELEGLKAAQERIKALVARIAELKSELKIE